LPIPDIQKNVRILTANKNSSKYDVSNGENESLTRTMLSKINTENLKTW
jgi:hypothetical protein